MLRAIALAVAVGWFSVAVGAQNLLTNGSFDDDLSAWTVFGLPPAAAWSPIDAAGAASSGSAALTATLGSGSSAGVRQCVAVSGGTTYAARVEGFVPTQSEPGEVFMNLNFFADTACADSEQLTSVLAGTQSVRNAWVMLARASAAPASARSAALILSAHKNVGATSGQPLTVRVDNAFLGVDDPNTCVPGSTVLCLNQNGRFKVELTWRAPDGSGGAARTIDIGKRDSGLFYFFSENNAEMLVKVLRACNLPGFNSYWVFYAATTNVEFTLTVTDTLTQQVRRYRNELNQAAEPVQDTDAFRTCP